MCSKAPLRLSLFYGSRRRIHRRVSRRQSRGIGLTTDNAGESRIHGLSSWKRDKEFLHVVHVSLDLSSGRFKNDIRRSRCDSGAGDRLFNAFTIPIDSLFYYNYFYTV